MLTRAELLQDIQAETGEISSEAMDLIGHLTSAESCETLEDLRIYLLEARHYAACIIANINDQIARIPAPDSTNDAVKLLEEAGATRETKEDRSGETRSGWWMDDVFLAPLSNPKLALEAIRG